MSYVPSSSLGRALTPSTFSPLVFSVSSPLGLFDDAESSPACWRLTRVLKTQSHFLRVKFLQKFFSPSGPHCAV